MTIFNYDKAFRKAKARAYKRHVRYQASERRWAAKHKRPFEAKPFVFDNDSWAVPWKSRLGIFKYKARSVCTFDPDMLEARSYGHWIFVRQYKGKIVFNDHSYSATTRGHQWRVRALLGELGIKIDIEVDTSASLSGLHGMDAALRAEYSRLFTAQMKSGRRNAKPRNLKPILRKIQALRDLGLRVSKADLKTMKEGIQANETIRLDLLAKRSADRKILRDRAKAIATTDPATLNPKDLETETNSDIRRALVNRIGMPRILKELNATVLDRQDEYELVDLGTLGDSDRWGQPIHRSRPYLKMLNPSTGEIHVEGVAPHIRTVAEALAWRNTLDGAYQAPLKLT